MCNPDAEHDRKAAAAKARWGDRVLRRSAATVLERASLTEPTRTELEQIAEPERDGDEDR